MWHDEDAGKPKCCMMRMGVNRNVRDEDEGKPKSCVMRARVIQIVLCCGAGVNRNLLGARITCTTVVNRNSTLSTEFQELVKPKLGELNHEVNRNVATVSRVNRL